jgi:hypothetical protein
MRANTLWKKIYRKVTLNIGNLHPTFQLEFGSEFPIDSKILQTKGALMV